MDEPPKREKPPRRTERVTVRFTVAEHGQLQAQAEAARVDISTLARALLLDEAIPGEARKATSDEKQLARMLVQLGKIGSNINQLARYANTTTEAPSAAAVDRLAKEMAALRRVLREEMDKW